MEKLIDSVPESIERIDNDGKITQSGFCVRYSVKDQKWFCGYGRNLKGQRDEYVGSGFSPLEAVDDFVKNCFKNHEKK